jgi:hypothetical protein
MFGAALWRRLVGRGKARRRGGFNGRFSVLWTGREATGQNRWALIRLAPVPIDSADIAGAASRYSAGPEPAAASAAVGPSAPPSRGS